MATKTLLTRLRESERELESQLANLRSQIREVKRGENRRIKDANKYIARTLLTIERTSKAQERLERANKTGAFLRRDVRDCWRGKRGTRTADTKGDEAREVSGSITVTATS